MNDQRCYSGDTTVQVIAVGIIWVIVHFIGKLVEGYNVINHFNGKELVSLSDITERIF